MTTPTTSPSAQPEPTRPGGAADGALYDALEVEHAAIYGYGIVSAHSTFDRNYLVADAMNEHRARREAGIALMEERGAQAPLPAAGYRLPGEVDPAKPPNWPSPWNRTPPWPGGQSSSRPTTRQCGPSGSPH